MRGIPIMSLLAYWNWLLDKSGVLSLARKEVIGIIGRFGLESEHQSNNRIE
jgi:hypothetical protein